MAKQATPDEQPKKRVARSVVTEKRQYFVPSQGISFEAESSEEAVKMAQKAGADSAEKEGDE